MDVEVKRRNPYRTVGIVLLLANVIPGLLLFALVASIVGEEQLEGEAASAWVGSVIVFLPPVVGLLLLIFGRRIDGWLPAGGMLWPLAAAAIGLVCLVVGVAGLSNAGSDPNIGASLLVLAGPILVILGLVRATVVGRSSN